MDGHGNYMTSMDTVCYNEEIHGVNCSEQFSLAENYQNCTRSGLLIQYTNFGCTVVSIHGWSQLAVISMDTVTEARGRYCCVRPWMVTVTVISMDTVTEG